MNNKTIDQKIQRAEQEITRLEHQKKIKQHEAKQLERIRRNRRIFTRGGMLEHFMQRPLLLTDDQVCWCCLCCCPDAVARLKNLRSLHRKRLRK